jgi:hypothetical protein
MAIGYDAGPIYPNDSGGEVYALPTQPAQLSTARTTGEQKRPGEGHPVAGGGLKELVASSTVHARMTIDSDLGRA